MPQTTTTSRGNRSILYQSALPSTRSRKLTIVPPTAEPATQIKLPAPRARPAEARLQVPQPVARDVDGRRQQARRGARRDQDEPDLARVPQAAQLAQQARGAPRQQPQPLALLGVLEDPVDGRQVVVADAPPRAVAQPVERRAVLAVAIAVGVGGGGGGSVVVVDGAVLAGERKVRAVARRLLAQLPDAGRGELGRGRGAAGGRRGEVGVEGLEESGEGEFGGELLFALERDSIQLSAFK